MTGQIALSAGILRSRDAGRPAMRVCMCTGSIVLLTVDPALPIGRSRLTAAVRSWLGAIIGTAFHWTAEAVVLPLVIRPVDPACKWASPLPLNHGYQIASVRFRRDGVIGDAAAQICSPLLSERDPHPWRWVLRQCRLGQIGRRGTHIAYRLHLTCFYHTPRAERHRVLCYSAP